MSSHATDLKTAIRKGVPAPWLLATTAIVALWALAPQTRPAAAQAIVGGAGAVQSFDIPAQPLASALNAFGRQAGLQVTLASSTTRGLTSRAVTGSYAPRQALALMLEGTGLPFQITADRTVMVGQQNAVDAGAVGADGSVVLDTIEVGGAHGANRPFETPGTTNFISSEELERFPGLTAGSIFQGTPGVISGSSNNGAAIDPNIRGLQGMNRVATTIDGSQQSTSSYRGYAGVTSRTFVDPDLISGITVTKGPEGAVGGAIGGTIAMETLGIADVLRAGENYGVRARVGLNSNGVEPVIGQKTADFGNSDAENGNASLAAAVTEQNVDLVAAYVRRKSGNYFAGTQGDLTAENYLGEQQRLSNYFYGQQVYNTSEDVTSGLLKATLRPADGHELQLGYLYYGNDFGEVSPTLISVGNATTWQIPLSSAAINQLTARYHFKPQDNDLIDFKANAYASNVDEVTVFSLIGRSAEIKQQTRNFGFNADNTSRFAAAGTPISLRYGGTYTLESASPSDPLDVEQFSLWALPANGDRRIATLFARAKWDPLSWLSVEAGAEYLNYDTAFSGDSFYNPGAPYTGYSGDGVSPMASITLTPLPGWQIYGQYSTGIRPPSLREVSQTRSDQRFNPNLDAEHAVNYEVGTNLLKNDVFLHGDKVRTKLSYFENTTNDYIGREFTNLQTMMFFNYDYVRFKGFELSGGYDAGFGFIDFGFNYYTDFEACFQDGECISYTSQADFLANQVPPRFTASVTAGLRFWDDRITLGGRLTYMGERLAPMVADTAYFSNVAKNWAPYTVVDLFGQWKINDTLTLDVGVQNLFDAYYVDAINNTDMPAPGRVIRGSLTAKLGGSEPVTWLPFGRPASARNMPWTGLYLGANVGYGFGGISGTTTPLDGSANAIAATESADLSLANIIGGAQAGYNYQFSNGIVLGVEGDFGWARMSKTQNALATEAQLLMDANMLQASTDYSFDWFATVRGRAGYAWDKLMVYGTAGVAFLREEEERTQYQSDIAYEARPAGNRTTPFFTEISARTRTGLAIGGGAEYAIADNWSIKAEYLFSAFGSESFLFKDARAGVTKSYSVTRQVGTKWVVRSEPLCATRGGLFCDLVERPVYETTNYIGSSTISNGREASNSADLQLLKIGVNYRF